MILSAANAKGSTIAVDLADHRLAGRGDSAYRAAVRPAAGGPGRRRHRLRGLGWLATVNRENRYGRIEATDTQLSPPPAASAEAASSNPAEATPHPAEPTAEQDRAQPGDR